MTTRFINASVRLLLVMALLVTCIANDAHALTYNYFTSSDIDTLRLSFENTIPLPYIRRSGLNQLTITLPANTLNPISNRNPVSFDKAKFLQGVQVQNDSIIVTTKSPEFGYIASADTPRRLDIQFYRDTQGGQWKSEDSQTSEASPTPTTAPTPTSTLPQGINPSPPPAVMGTPPPATSLDTPPPLTTSPVVFPSEAPEGNTPNASSVSGTITPPPTSTPTMTLQDDLGSGVLTTPTPTPVSPPPTEEAEAEAYKEPFFAVPSSIRAPIRQTDRSSALVVRPQDASSNEQSDASTMVTPSPTPQGSSTSRSAVAPPPDIKLPDLSEARSTPSPTSSERGVINRAVSPAPTATPGPEQSEVKRSVTLPEASPQQTVTPPPAPPAATPDEPTVRQVVATPEAIPSPAATREETPATPEQAMETPTSTPLVPESISGQAAVKQSVAPRPQVEVTPEDSGAPIATTEAPKEDDKKSEAPPEEELPTEEQVTSEAPQETPEEAENKDYNDMVAAQAAMMSGNYNEAKRLLEGLKNRPDVKPEIREESLYNLADTYFEMYKDKLNLFYDQIRATYEEAINHNSKSDRIPAALLQLGLLSLRVNNTPEAQGYFNVLKQRYPDNENVPLINYYWGDYYYNSGEYNKAADEFQALIQNYPENTYVREAAMGLAKSFVKLGYYDQASRIVDYIGKRWPRYYIEYPPLLRVSGDIDYKLGNFDSAKENYLTYYNIDPKAEGIDIVLARLGDLYSLLGRKVAARDFYDLVIHDYPDSEGGLISKMRLAEEGVFDQPSIEDMFSAFSLPQDTSPEKIYKEIVEKHSKSPLAPLAQLKLAMWYLYRDRDQDSMEAVDYFLRKFPDSDLTGRAREVGAQAFDRMISRIMQDGNYRRVLLLWEDNPFLSKNPDALLPKSVLAVALSYLRLGNPREALKLAVPYIKHDQTPSGEMALSLLLSIYMESQSWNDILQLASKVQDWKMDTDLRRRTQYAMAVALENLGDERRSRVLWSKLAADPRLDPAWKAEAMYFQAKYALDANDPSKARVYGQEALSLFDETMGGKEKIKNTLNILIYSNQVLGNYSEALDRSNDYAKLTTKGDADWAANRFRQANIYRSMGNTDEWKKILEDMRDTMPDSLYGKMAATELKTRKLERQAVELTNPDM
ncbi:tetratricopeptide repeat protein [Desulfovibrio inopinatus]|uniref:tetratricopeptide repeat protein n=1 Tax=Desulfovibrio inopinatus TaxID=102109 RepID=UPI00146F9CA1|nr:tetratricopeptide repeat protein [Desulfovibrio inopinatus]